MRTNFKVILFLLVGFLIAGDCTSVLNAKETTSTASAKLLDQVLSQYEKHLMEDTPLNLAYRQKYGLDITQLPDISKKKEDENQQKLKTFLEKLQTVNPDELSIDQQLTWKLLKWQLENSIREHKYIWLTFPIASYYNLIPYINHTFTTFQFRQEKHLRHYLGLLDQYPGLIEELLSFLKQQLNKKIALSKPGLQAPIAYLHSIIQPGEKSLLYVDSQRLKAGSISQNPKAISQFQNQVTQLINKRVNPALEKLTAFIEGEYRAQAPDKVGLWQYPQGKEYYRFLVKLNTTLDLTPEEVHRTGLKEIEKLVSQLDKIRRELNFSGDVEAFVHYMKTDPRFKPKSPEDIGKRMIRIKEMAEDKLPLFFSHLPKAPCRVKRLDPLLEASMTYGYYQNPTAADPCGYYLFNASNLDKRNILNGASAALILHELLPGHHFQIALQSENDSLCPFRRELSLNAYAEGWGEYAAGLGFEMGIYQTPYDRCARILQDLFMSVRLVVDTGMNYFQWPREKAINFMKKYLITSDVEIQSETLRYSTGIPAQALGYKIGSLKIWELRRTAEKTLGKKFDIRRFHDVILSSGTLPLFLLEEQVNRFIKTEMNKPGND